MRYTPAALALSLALAVTSSHTWSAPREVDPRAVALLSEGRSLLDAGEVQEAITAFEATLAVDPGYTEAYLLLADAARKDGMQGKAIHYYRIALARDPDNLAALSGEGKALLEKGAVEKARKSLARLEAICGSGCDETQTLAAAIQNRPATPVVAAADAAVAEAIVTK